MDQEHLRTISMVSVLDGEILSSFEVGRYHLRSMKPEVFKIASVAIICLSLALSLASSGKAMNSGEPRFGPANIPKSQSLQKSAVVRKRAPTTTPIFTFYSDEFWLNLHNFLYVLGRAQNNERDASREAVVGAPADQQSGLEKLNAKEQAIWQTAVEAYKTGLSKKDAVFDDPLPAITGALARAGDVKTLNDRAIDVGIASTLRSAAPVYRKAWWNQHRQSNRSWQESIQALVNRYGADVLSYITKAYNMNWPEAGFPVHVSAYANWAGAYSTKGNLLVLSSNSSANQGLYGLELVFHEGMHQWDEQVFDVLRAQAARADKFFPRGLDHALIFFTAGEAVRSVVPEHVPYAEKFGLWQRGLGSLKPAIEEIWKPYLQGKGSRDETLVKLIKRTGVEPPKK